MWRQSSLAGSFERVKCDRNHGSQGTSLFMFFIHVALLALFICIRVHLPQCTTAHTWRSCGSSGLSPSCHGWQQCLHPSLWLLGYPLKRIQKGSKASAVYWLSASKLLGLTNFTVVHTRKQMELECLSSKAHGCSVGPPATWEEDKGPDQATTFASGASIFSS